MSIVSDASVLIFLGKIKHLDLLKKLFRGPHYVPDLVRNEVFVKDLPPSEEEYLTQKLQGWEIIPWQPRIKRLAGGLSLSDISVLEVAKKVEAEWVLADEKALRQVLLARRHKVTGTLGILLSAYRIGSLSVQNVREAVEELISTYHFRIGAETYRSFLKLLVDS